MKKSMWIGFILAVVFAIVIIIYIRSIRKNKPVDITQFYPAAYKWLSKEEGGRAYNDLDVGGDPAPGTNGVGANRGVRWATFKSSELTHALNYTPTVELFLQMPDSLWERIVRYYFAKGDKFSKNPLIAAYMGLWHWGGWNTNIVSEEKVKDTIRASANDHAALANLVALRKYYFEKLGELKPQDKPYVSGWKARADRFYDTFNNFL